MSSEILKASDLPESLWDPQATNDQGTPNGRLFLPENLNIAYREALQELGLIKLSKDLNAQKTATFGEEGEEGANEHFATCFSGSCGRVQLYSIDPHSTFRTTRDALVRLFSAGKITMLDIPLGAGAAAVSLLSIVAQLRLDEILPSHDLEITVVGGDFNTHQIKLATLMFNKLKNYWMSNGISAKLITKEWNVMDDESTGELVDKWIELIGPSSVPIVVGANFSGFLGTSTTEGASTKRIDEAEACLRSIFRDVSKHKAETLWIEPTHKLATKHFLPKLRKQVFERFTRIKPTLDNQPTSTAMLSDPVISGGKFVVRATGIQLIANS